MSEDLISRQNTIEKAKTLFGYGVRYVDEPTVIGMLDKMPTVDQEIKRDIPIPPNETIDTTWGIERKRPVCPNCDYYLPMVHFFPLNKDASGNAKRITYCEHCGQAIDWSGAKEDWK